MALVRWEPFREMESLQREMNRLFETFSPTTPLAKQGDGISFVPAAEMKELPEEIQLKLEVPGLEPKDLDIEVEADSVAIKGERKTETKTEENGVTRTEFRYGSFHRVIPLPSRIDNTNVKADYKDGILHLSLPKAAEEKNKRVKVNIG